LIVNIRTGAEVPTTVGVKSEIQKVKLIKTTAQKNTETFDKLAEKYEHTYAAYLKHTHHTMMQKLSLKKEDEILDVSAGTGMLAEGILNEFGPLKRLVLNDPSKGMLEKAKYRLRYKKGVEFTSDFSEELSFREDTFTKIICLNSFRYYSDHTAVLTHFRRMLKPGGHLYILSWNRSGFFRITNWIVSLLSNQELNTRSLDEMEKLLDESGFRIKEEDTWRFRWWNFFFVKCK
jgi:ubiquinone/menaquinone biosynthesis C-methylase UbiE